MHGMPGVTWGMAFGLGNLAGIVPKGVNHLWIQPAVAARFGGRRKKQGSRTPSFKILLSFPLTISSLAAMLVMICLKTFVLWANKILTTQKFSFKMVFNKK